MASDNRPEIVLDGDVSPFRQKLREAAADLKRFGDDGASSFERMTGPLGVLQSKFVQVGAILAGGKVFQAAVEESKRFVSEANAMSKALGISTTEAGALNIALGDIYSGADEFIGASQQLGRQLRSNEEDLNAMGLKTRDANGEYRNLKDLMFESIDVLNSYKEGTDRNLAAQVLFGRGAGEVTALLKLNNEVVDAAREKQAALGLTIGVENVQSAKQYKAAMNDVGDVLSAVKKAIGDALMPVLTDLGNWFAALGPAAVTIIKGSIGGLVTVFHLLTTGVTVLWETLNALVVTFTEPIRAMASALANIVDGDFKEAAEQLKNIPSTIGDAWGTAFDEMSAKAQSTRDRVWNAFADPTGMTPGQSGSKSYQAPPDDKKKDKKAAADPSMMSYYEAALAEEKRLSSEKDALREYTKEEERSFWQTLLQFADLNSKDRVSIEKKTADLTVAIRRQEAKDKQAMDAEASRFKEETALSQIDAELAAAQAAVEASRISKKQLAELEVQFEQRRFEVQRAGLQERQQLALLDPNTSEVEKQRLQNQMLQLEQQYGTRMIQVQRKTAQQSNQIWDDLSHRMSSLWDKGIQSLMNGTFRWRNAFKAIGMELANWFATNVVGNMVKEWLAGQVKQLALKLGFLASEQTAQTASSATVTATKATEATAVSAANAVEAGTGSAAAMSSIPWVGPVLALAAMAAVFAAVSGMGSKVKSASKGFDIPKGVNPMTQLHEEEMVLPSHLANPLRSLLNGGAPAGNQGEGSVFAPQLNINAINSRDVVRALKQDNVLYKAMKDMQRRGVRK